MINIRHIVKNELVGSITALLTFFLLVLSSCSGGGAVKSSDINELAPIVDDTKSEKLNIEIASRMNSLKDSSSLADYKVGPEDLINIQVFQVEELNTKVRISAQGYIGLPLVGKIEAGGLSVSELEAAIAKKYENYLADPIVSVFVEEYRSQQIVVLGSVSRPQVYYVTGQVYLLDMLSMAGGLSSEAGDICTIRKAVSAGDADRANDETIVVDLNELLISGRAELNIPLSSGDVVHVPRSGVFFVDGAVNSAGVYQIKGKTTLTQSISMAKGMMYEAIKSDITILRDNGKPERDIIVANYNAILDGKEEDILIKDKDIIIVPKSGVKSFLKGFATSIGIGSFRMGKGF